MKLLPLLSSLIVPGLASGATGISPADTIQPRTEDSRDDLFSYSPAPAGGN